MFESGETTLNVVTSFFKFEAIPTMDGVFLAGIDATEEKKEIERSKRNEELLVDSQKTAHLGTWEWDMVDQTVRWSPQLYLIYGITPEMYAPSFEGYLSLIDPEDRQRVSAVIQSALRDKTPFSYDEKIIHADGRTRYLHTWGRPILNEKNELVSCMGVCQDVTERVLLEHKSHRAFQIYREIFETAEEGIWLIDEKADTTHVNMKMSEMLGYHPSEMIGKSFFDFMDAEGKEVTKLKLDQRRKGEREQFEFVLRNKQGQRVWALIEASPFFDHNGKYTGALGMVSNISRRHRTETFIKAQNKVFDILTHSGSLEEALTVVVQTIEELIEGSMASILLMDDEGKRLLHGAAPSLPKEFSDAVHGRFIGPHAGSCGTAAFTKNLVIATDINSDELWADYKDIASKHELRACWSSPILSETGKVLGTFAVYFKEIHRPTDYDLEVIKDATAAATLSIEHIRLFENEKKNKENTKFLAAARKILASSIDYEFVLKKIPEVIVNHMADWCFLVLVENETLLVPIAGAGTEERMKFLKDLEGYRPDMDAPEGIPRAVKTGQSQLYSYVTEEQLVPDSTGWTIIGTKDPKYLQIVRELGLVSYMVVPILLRGKVKGALFIASGTHERHYSKDDLLLAIELAQSCSMAMDNAILYREVNRAIKAREEFISIASHELRTPLTSLKGRVDLLSLMIERNTLPADVSEQIEPVISGLSPDMDNFAKLIEMLLDISRMGNSRFFLKKEKTNISQLLFSELTRMRNEFDQAHSRLSLKFQQDIVGELDGIRVQ